MLAKNIVRLFSKHSQKSKWNAERLAQHNEDLYSRDTKQMEESGKIVDSFNQNPQKFDNLYRPFLDSLYKDKEIQTRDLDLQQIMGQLNQKEINYDKVFSFVKGNLDKNEHEKLKKEEQIVKQKMEEQKQEKTYIDFFNNNTKKLIQHTPPDVLYELGIRAFTGSRDVPKDDIKAVGLISSALQQAILTNNEFEIDMSEYYLALMEKQQIRFTMDKNRGHLEPEDRIRMVQNNEILEQKAQKGIGQALYTYGKDLYQTLRNHQTEGYRNSKEIKQDMEKSYNYLVESIKKGVHSAYFFLGIMAIEGIYVQKDVEMGIEFLVRGASKNNAYCYYYLSMIYNEGIVVEKNPKLEFLYLKRSAEEGFVQMQHNLGMAYYQGVLTKKNDRLALAWLRESTRNGYMPSYHLAGDILYEGNFNNLPIERAVEQNRLFALTQYMGAYQSGALFLEPQIRKCMKELVEIEGYSQEILPKITFAQIPKEEKDIIMEQFEKDQARRKQVQEIQKQRMNN